MKLLKNVLNDILVDNKLNWIRQQKAVILYLNVFSRHIINAIK